MCLARIIQIGMDAKDTLQQVVDFGALVIFFAFAREQRICLSSRGYVGWGAHFLSSS
jgi:hypothetical protein